MEVQKHGFIFEQLIMDNGIFPDWNGTSDYTAKWDIGSQYDTVHNLPTSLKTTKGSSIEMGDARRIWGITHPFRMIVGYTVQETKSIKRIAAVKEYIITVPHLNELRGSVDLAMVTSFTESISAFAPGKTGQAAWQESELKVTLRSNTNSKLKLNPKVDSKTQRRLQCSIPCKWLDSTFGVASTSIFKGVDFGKFEIHSKARTFKNS